MLNDIFLNKLPSLDLHGYDYDSASVATNDFVSDNLLLENKKIVIIHGIGEGIVKASVHQALSKNKHVKKYCVSNDNLGCTIIELF